MNPWHTVLAVLINLLWGSMFIAAVIGLREFPPILFTGIRFGLLAVLLVGFLRVPRPLMASLFRIGLVMGGKRLVEGALLTCCKTERYS